MSEGSQRGKLCAKHHWFPRSLSLTLAGALACLSCTGESHPAPRLVEVRPFEIPENATTRVVLRGEHFYGNLQLRLDNQQAPSFNRRWRVEVGGLPLADGQVTWLNSSEIEAVIQAGLPPAIYAVRIVAPSGQSAELLQGVQVGDVGAGTEPLSSLLDAGSALSGNPVTQMPLADAATGASVPPTNRSNASGDAGFSSGDSNSEDSGVSSGSLVTEVVLEDQPGGIGTAVAASLSYTTDDELTLHAVGRNAQGQFVADLSGQWSVDSGIGSASTVAGPSLTVDFVLPGSGNVAFQHSSLGTVSSSVVVVAGRAASLEILPDTRVASLGIDTTVLFSASARDADNNPTTDIGTITWSVASGSLSTLDTATGELLPTATGSGTLRATSSYGVFDDSNLIEITQPPALVDADPFGDGTTFAYAVEFQNQIFLGPSIDGSKVLNLGSSGNLAASLELELGAGLALRNGAGPPYSAIGFSGCGVDTLECGPDNENGRGQFGSGSLAGQEWLVLGGARSQGDLNTLYMASALTNPLQFRTVDLSELLGSQTRGISVVHAFGDRIYLGFPDQGGRRPYLLALLTPPPIAGFVATEGLDALDLEARNMPGLKLAGTSSIDALADFNNRLYVANAGGWVRATVPAPLSFDDSPLDWVSVLPSANEYSAKLSTTSDKTADLFPSDRAIPQMAELAGWFYVARNTTDGPQLWVCDPTLTGAANCDSGDWRLAAANTSEDPALSQFNNPNNTSISALVATNSALFVGYDNAVDGAVLFKTTVFRASDIADFRGEGGCSAFSHPSSCDGLNGNGFGGNSTRIFHGTVVDFGASPTLFLTAGDGAGPVQLYRFLP